MGAMPAYLQDEKHMLLCCCPRADCDVFFRRPVRLVDFGTPLPSALGLG